MEVRLRHEIRAGTVQTPGHFFKAAAAIEFIHGSHNRFTLRLGAGVFDGFPERFIRNINCRFHASKLLLFGILSSAFWKLKIARGVMVVSLEQNSVTKATL